MPAFSRASRLTKVAAEAALSCLLLLFAAFSAFGQSNPVPFVNQPLVPSAVAPGGPDFTLTVNGTGFVTGATVNWNGAPLATTFVSGSKLTATVPAANIAAPRTASITVSNPGSGGGQSNGVYLPVANPQSSLTLVPDKPQGFATFCGGGAFADFNGDGTIDIATTTESNPGSLGHCINGSTLGVLIGNGDGTFQPLPQPSSYQLGQPTGPFVADVNGDGKPDLIFFAQPVFGQPPDCASGCMEVFLGNGDGTFTRLLPDAPISGGPTPPSQFAYADFNGDGKIDLAFISGGSLDIMLGNGDGTFSSPVSLATGAGGWLAVGDFNGDGRLDLIAPFANSIAVLLGNGDGTFTKTAGFPIAPAGVSFSSGVTADFNGDGKLDLALSLGDPADTVVVLTGNGNGTFTAGASYQAPANAIPSSLQVGDFNGDGRLDLAAALGWINGGCTSSSNIVEFLLGNGDGTFHPQLAGNSFQCQSNQSAVADINGDGKLDLGGYFAGIAGFLQSASPTLSPANLAFPNQTVGSSSPAETLRLANFSGSALSIANAAFSGANPSDFAQTNTYGTLLASSSVCTFSATFTPGALGVRSATLSVSDSDPTSPQSALLSGTGINPTAVPSVNSLTFASQPLNTTSAPQSFTVTNNGVGTLTIAGVAGSHDFAQTNTCGSSLAQGAVCTINVTFTPSTSGTEIGSITISDNAVNSPQMVSLAGTGVPPAVTVNPTTLTFGSFGVGVASPLQAVTVSNNGPGPLQVTGVTVSGDFSQTNNCIGTIAALASCTVNVTFTATAAGTRSGFVTITDDAVASPQTVTLTGTGVPPTATASPASLGFGNQAVGMPSASQPVTLTNSGPGPLTIAGITFTGTNANDFPQTNTCPVSPATLAASMTCSINVTFKPSINGAESASLTITDNAASSPQTVTLNGTGQAPVAALSSASLDFPGQSVGVMSAPEPVMLTNSGSLPLTISGFVITSPFTQSNNCPATLAAGANCTINVTFTAGFEGTTYGSLLVSDNSLGSASQTVSLTGEATVSFGPQLAQTTSSPQPVTIANGSTTKTVTVTGVTTTGDFAVATNPCGMLPPGQSCAPMVTFTPTTGGTRTGTLVITDTSPGSPHSVPLTGTGQDFVVTPSPPSATVNAGGTTTFTLSVASQGGFNQTVNLSCALPAMMTLATCNVSPMAVNPISATPVAATVMITTTAATEVAPRRVGDDETSPLQRPPRVQNLRNLWMILVAFTLIALALPARRRRAIQAAMGPALSPSASLRVNSAEGTSPLQRFALAMTLLLMLAWAACGGGANVTHMPGTPPGIYTITITAVDPQANLTQTITFKLTVNP